LPPEKTAISSSATPASRDTRSASTWIEVRPALVGRFGATGTGKSFLTRLVLAGLMHYNKASVLVLDMHNEYGLRRHRLGHGKSDRPETKFGSKVQRGRAGRGATIRGQAPDFNLEIAMSDISPADVEMLSRELNLRETTPTTLNALVTSFRGQELVQPISSP
jgi:uncharacterized protein